MQTLRLLAGVSALALLLAPAVAPAQVATGCQPDPAADGDTVTCASDDADGFASEADDLDIAVNPGITVSNGDDAFELDDADGASLTNEGTVRSTGDRAFDTDDDATVTNRGRIEGADDAIRGDNRLTVVNEAGAEIVSAEQEGIDATNDLDITNDGLIDAGDEGIQGALRATIVNRGQISAVDDAIQIQGDADITNSGTIVSEEEDGIDIDSGIVRNQAGGTIRGLGAGTAGVDVDPIEAEDGEFPAERGLTVLNEGTIRGAFGILVDPDNAESQTIVNAGTLIGDDGVAAQLEGGADIFEALPGGVIDGTVDLGTGEDRLIVTDPLSGILGTGQAFFDGGEDTDTIAFDPDLTLDDLIAITLFPARGYDAFSIVFRTGPEGQGQIRFRSFEAFEIGGTTLTLDELTADLSTIPLPATLLLLGGGLGILGAVARRGERRA